MSSIDITSSLLSLNINQIEPTNQIAMDDSMEWEEEGGAKFDATPPTFTERRLLNFQKPTTTNNKTSLCYIINIIIMLLVIICIASFYLI